MDEDASDTSLPEWLVAARDANERERQGAIAELDALAGEVDAARLFVVLLANMAFVPAREWRESMHGILAAQVELLAFELFPRFGRSASDQFTSWHVQRGLATIATLFNAEQRARTFDSPRTAAADPPGGGPGGFDSLLSHLRIDAEIVHGSAYPEQTRREIEEIQGHFEAEFAGYAGIGPKRAVALAFALVGVVEDRLNASLTAARADLDAAEAAWVHARRRRRRGLSGAEQALLATFRSAADARTFKVVEHLARTAPDQLPVAPADIRLDPPLTDAEWVAYCRLIGCDQAARSRMSAPIEMRERPLYVLPDGRLFPYDISNTLDQLWAAFEREARLADPTWVGGAYAHHRGEWLEDRIVQYLRRTFPAGRIFRHLSYPDPDHAGRTAEIDVIVHWPPFLMLVEAKAVQFRLEGQLGDTRLLKNDLRANVQNAFWQADRAARHIQQGEEARFTEIDGGRVLTISRGALRRTYLTTVSQHTLAGVATRLAATRPLGLFRDDQYPWALSIADLDIITQFCPGPDVLLHYVERRLAIQAEKINLIGDELDFFGAYLDARLQPERIWQHEGGPFDLVALSGFQEPFDEAMAFRRGELPTAPDIRLAVPDEIAAILGALRQHAASPDERWIAFSLLGLPDRALGAVAHLLREIRAQTPTPGAFRSGVYGEDDWVVVAVATLDRSPDDLYQATGSRTTLEKYRRRATRAIGLGIMSGDRSQPFECVLWGDSLWEHDERIEEALREQPPAAYLPGTQLPGRNQPCICGSGRKFKHCCLPKIGVARRPSPGQESAYLDFGHWRRWEVVGSARRPLLPEEVTMPTLPRAMLHLLAPFAPLFSCRVWCRALVLVAGTLLAPGKRTVCAALRAMGLSQSKHFGCYHRVLNRAKWSSLAVARVLLGLLVATFAPVGPLVVGLDETIERRWGPQIAAKGLYRDAVRSSKDYFVKVSGLRWLCLMLLVPLPWAGRVWALPVLTILAPSERHDRAHGRRHKTLPDWARQALLQLRRWLPERVLVVVADSGYAAIALLARCGRLGRPIALITRLRLDAALCEPAPPRQPGQRGRPRLKGQRLPTLAARRADPATVWTPVTVANWYGQGPRAVEVASDTAAWYHGGRPPVPLRWVLIRDPQGAFDTQALLCTDPTADPAQILAWFVLRWQLEVTFAEVRRHLGVETQRQWADLAIPRTTPALLGLFSLVTLWAHPRMGATGDAVRQAAWYHKGLPTFSDARALVRRELWTHTSFLLSTHDPDMIKIPRAFLARLTDALCYAA